MKFFYNSAENRCLITDQMKKCNTGLTRLCFYVNPSSDLETGNFFGQSPDFCDNCDLKQSQVVAMIYETRTKSYVADFPAVFVILPALTFVMKHKKLTNANTDV